MNLCKPDLSSAEGDVAGEVGPAWQVTTSIESDGNKIQPFIIFAIEQIDQQYLRI